MDSTLCTTVVLGGFLLSALQCLLTHGAAIGLGVALERLYPDEVLYAEARAARHIKEGKDYLTTVVSKTFAKTDASKDSTDHFHVADDGCVFGHIEQVAPLRAAPEDEEEDLKKEE